jgi:hypothetical protein
MAKFIKITRVDNQEKMVVNINKIVGITEEYAYLGTDEEKFLAVIHLCSSFRDGIMIDESLDKLCKRIRKAKK